MALEVIGSRRLVGLVMDQARNTILIIILMSAVLKPVRNVVATEILMSWLNVLLAVEIKILQPPPPALRAVELEPCNVIAIVAVEEAR